MTPHLKCIKFQNSKEKKKNSLPHLKTINIKLLKEKSTNSTTQTVEKINPSWIFYIFFARGELGRFISTPSPTW